MDKNKFDNRQIDLKEINNEVYGLESTGWPFANSH